MTILDTAARHLKQIEKIENLCFSVPWTYTQLEQQMLAENCVFLVAENENSDILGYVGMMYVLDEGYISNIAVSPESRRQGVAGALLKALEQRAVELSLAFITLEVRESNAPAVGLYCKHGFSAVGIRRAYYEKPKENAVLMTKFLVD